MRVNMALDRLCKDRQATECARERRRHAEGFKLRAQRTAVSRETPRDTPGRATITPRPSHRNAPLRPTATQTHRPPSTGSSTPCRRQGGRSERRTVKKVCVARNATASPMSEASDSRPSGMVETNMLRFSSVRPSLPANEWTSGVLPATGQTELNRILSLASSSASDLDAVLTQPLEALRQSAAAGAVATHLYQVRFGRGRRAAVCVVSRRWTEPTHR